MTLPKFTKEEQGFIDHCFETTLYHFVQNPLDKGKEKDVLEAINYRNYNIGSIGIDNHKLMHSILDKMGYCKDGKTTKTEAMQKEIALEQEKASIWATEKAELISQAQKQIKELQGIISDLESHDEKMDKKEKAIMANAEEKIKENLKREREESQKNIIVDIEKRIDQMNLRELRALAREKNIANYSRMAKADLKTEVEKTQ